MLPALAAGSPHRHRQLMFVHSGGHFTAGRLRPGVSVSLSHFGGSTMFGNNHRLGHKPSLGGVLGKLALDIAGAIIKKKVEDKFSGKTGSRHGGARGDEDRDERLGCRTRR